MTVQQVDSLAFDHSWTDWQLDHEARLAAPHGFLAITSLNWLYESPQRFSDAPGSWSSTADGVTVDLADDEYLIVDDQVVIGTYRFGVIAERDSINVGFGDAVIEVAKRGGFDIVRPRHPDNPLRLKFKGTPAYAPDPKWAIDGRYVQFDAPRSTTVGAAIAGLEHVYDAPGRIEFEVGGTPLVLTAFSGKRPGELTVLFTDETSGVTTYAANRVLHIEVPDADGRVIIDFNRASNLPCAYTDLATCPLPPAENRLPIAVEAGQKTPYQRRSGTSR